MDDTGKIRVGFAMCGSFCTFRKAITTLKKLVEYGYDVTAIMSFNAYSLDTRFGKAKDFVNELAEITGKPVLHDIESTEPVGPKKMFDLLAVVPCTGNTLAKLALGIIDTPVCMAVKSHLRNQRPVVIAVSTNDALSGSAKSIGMLRNYRNYYFVPLAQDNCTAKPYSMVADFGKVPETIAMALEGKQIQPMVL